MLRRGTPHSALRVVLTIAGSDSGGGAGIQADLKTFAALGVFGTSAITCVTAQNPERVAGIVALQPDFIALQIRTVCAGFRVAAAKTGMLYSAGIIRAVAQSLAQSGIRVLVVDPVMVATSGARLLKPNAIRELRSALLPLATVITPNLPEAETLCGHAISSLADAQEVAANLAQSLGTSCVIKGGHLGQTAQVVDVLCHRGRIRTFAIPRIKTVKTHGTGCTFSAALTALLARGCTMEDAVRESQCFVAATLARGTTDQRSIHRKGAQRTQSG
jgi:hydroxymethylpyrimidine/phosphomethylpyrimidine kinase